MYVCLPITYAVHEVSMSSEFRFSNLDAFLSLIRVYNGTLDTVNITAHQIESFESLIIALASDPLLAYYSDNYN